MSRVNEESGTLDADRMLERLIDLHRTATRADGVQRLELYHRAAVALRVTRRGVEDPGQTRLGSEDGVAARVQTKSDGGIRFAASAGWEHTAVSECVARAVEGSPLGIAATDAFSPPGGIRLDRDPVEPLPSPSQLRAWMEAAVEGLRSGIEAAGKIEALDCWVEAAATVESLVGPGGVTASRSRIRAWTLLRLRTAEDPARSPRPVFTAARRWSELDPLGWIDRVRERFCSAGDPAASDSVAVPVIFLPDAASKLVSALARTLHSSPDSIGAEGGPGWKLADDPNCPGALFGGSFDDAGFPTRRVVLADGARLTGSIGGPGSYRRASFRDPPLPAPSHLVLDPGEQSVTPDGLVVSELEIHPLPDGPWILEVDGALRRGGEIGPGVRGGFISTSPGGLLQRCAMRIGPAHSSHRRVRTPALVFTDLAARF